VPLPSHAPTRGRSTCCGLIVRAKGQASAAWAFAILCACNQPHHCDGHLPHAKPLVPGSAEAKYAHELMSAPALVQSGNESPDRLRVVREMASSRKPALTNLVLDDYKVGETFPIMSVHSVDPGSGPMIDYRWSSDSRALLLRGSTLAYDPKGETRVVTFLLLYSVEARGFHDLSVKN
jgi:hypothetical protein